MNLFLAIVDHVDLGGRVATYQAQAQQGEKRTFIAEYSGLAEISENDLQIGNLCLYDSQNLRVSKHGFRVPQRTEEAGGRIRFESIDHRFLLLPQWHKLLYNLILPNAVKVHELTFEYIPTGGKRRVFHVEDGVPHEPSMGLEAVLICDPDSKNLLLEVVLPPDEDNRTDVIFDIKTSYTVSADSSYSSVQRQHLKVMSLGHIEQVDNLFQCHAVERIRADIQCEVDRTPERYGLVPDSQVIRDSTILGNLSQTVIHQHLTEKVGGSRADKRLCFTIGCGVGNRIAMLPTGIYSQQEDVSIGQFVAALHEIGMLREATLRAIEGVFGTIRRREGDHGAIRKAIDEYLSIVPSVESELRSQLPDERFAWFKLGRLLYEVATLAFLKESSEALAPFCSALQANCDVLKLPQNPRLEIEKLVRTAKAKRSQTKAYGMANEIAKALYTWL